MVCVPCTVVCVCCRVGYQLPEYNRAGDWRCMCTCVPVTPEAVHVCVTRVSVCLTDSPCVVPSDVCVSVWDSRGALQSKRQIMLSMDVTEYSSSSVANSGLSFTAVFAGWRSTGRALASNAAMAASFFLPFAETFESSTAGPFVTAGPVLVSDLRQAHWTIDAAHVNSHGELNSIERGLHATTHSRAPLIHVAYPSEIVVTLLSHSSPMPDTAEVFAACLAISTSSSRWFRAAHGTTRRRRASTKVEVIELLVGRVGGE